MTVGKIWGPGLIRFSPSFESFSGGESEQKTKKKNFFKDWGFTLKQSFFGWEKVRNLYMQEHQANREKNTKI